MHISEMPEELRKGPGKGKFKDKCMIKRERHDVFGVEDDCMIWQGWTNENKTSPRPKMLYQGRKVSVVRLSYHLCVNPDFPIDGGQGHKHGVVRHLCGNSLCINPDHLIAGTQRENKADDALHGLFKVMTRVFKDPSLSEDSKEKVGVHIETVVAEIRKKYGLA